MTAAPIASCVRCHELFIRTHGNQKYCAACVVTKRLPRPAKEPESRLCEKCGEAFAVRYRHQRYCSRSCAGRFRDLLPEHVERDRRIIAAYKSGQSLRMIGRQEDLSQEGVRHILHRHGVVLRDRKESRPVRLPPPDLEVRLRQLYVEEQRSILFTADQLDVSFSTVRTWLKNLGIPRRSTQEQSRLDFDRGLREPHNRGRPISETQRERQSESASAMWKRRKEQEEWRWGEPRPCDECGTSFRPISPKNRFCQPSCREVATALRLANEPAGSQRRCANPACDRNFRPRTPHQQYCCHPCWMAIRHPGETTNRRSA